MTDNSAAMRQARQRDGHIKRQRAADALRAIVEGGEPVTFPAVARRAGVSVTLLYADRTLATSIAQARDRQRQAGRDRAWRLPARSLITEQSLRADLANAKEQVHRLTEELKLLRDRLAQELGANGDIVAGRLASPLLHQLEERATDLETENASLRQRIQELEGETRELAENLHAARAMNRELMTELNRPSSDPEPTKKRSASQATRPSRQRLRGPCH